MRVVVVLVAWCVVAAGTPAPAGRSGDPDDPTARVASDAAAKLVPRRHGGEAPRFTDRDAPVAAVPVPVGLHAPLPRALPRERVTGARPVLPVVLARSSRGPPVG